jgi:hypothetical protein
MKEVRAIAARTTNPNTPESDQQTMVLHTVTMSDGTERRVYATDPMAAIAKVNGGR